jgi:hypothetical protein
MKHIIVVGNIGMVYVGNSCTKAEEHYRVYMIQSQHEYGRASGEDVTWFKDGEIFKEYVGVRAEDEQE